MHLRDDVYVSSTVAGQCTINKEFHSPVQESGDADLKFNIKKTKSMASGPVTSWQTEGDKVETVTEFYFSGIQNHCIG